LSAVNSRKRKLIVVASLVVQLRRALLLHHSCTMWPIAQFTVEKESPLELLQFIQKYKLGNSVPNIMLRIFFTIAVGVATCERSFSKRKLIKNYLRSNLAVEKSCHTVYRATTDRQYKF